MFVLVGELPSAENRLPSWEWEELRSQVLKRDEVCVSCGGVATEVDHIRPLAIGGTNELDNLQLLCSSCHRKKTSRDQKKIARFRSVRRLDDKRRRFGL